MNRAQRRRPLQHAWADEQHRTGPLGDLCKQAEAIIDKLQHDFDDDAACTKCGFDAAEWWHWKRNTYEGRASDATQPLCNN